MANRYRKAGRYRQLDCRTWSDAKFRALSPLPPSGQALWLYLLLGPHNTALPGLFTLGQLALAEALGWPVPDLLRCWSEVSALGMAQADWPARVVYLPRAIEYALPDNPNVVKSWAPLVNDVPECPLKGEALRAIHTRLASIVSVAEAARQILYNHCADTVTRTVEPTVEGTVTSISNSNSNSNSNTPLPPSAGGGSPVEPLSQPEPATAPPSRAPDPDEAFRRTAVSDYPEFYAAARGVAQHYQHIVQPGWPLRNGPQTVHALLRDGVSADRLKNAARGYLAWLQREGKPRDVREAVYTFYSDAGSYREFLDWQPPPPTAPAPRPARPSRPGHCYPP